MKSLIFAKKLAENPSILLAASYGLGQGSTFVMLMLFRHFGYLDLSGVFVILISLLSFGLQFGDFGTQTYLLKKIADEEVENAHHFIISRAIWASFICTLFSIWSFFELKMPTVTVVVFLLPVVGVICASNGNAFLEARGNYLMVAKLNVLPWLGMALGASSYIYLEDLQLSVTLIGLFVLLASSLALFVSRKQLSLSYANFRFISTFSAIPFVISPLGGQIWFRYVLFSIESVVTLGGLGALGVARNVQVASLLCAGFVIRPRLRRYIESVAKSKHQVDIFGILNCYKSMLSIVSLLTLFLIVCMYFYQSDDQESVAYWLPIIYTFPLILLGQAANFANQIRNGGRYIVFSDSIGLIANILVFFSMKEFSPVYAIVAGEFAQASMLFAMYFAITNFTKK